MQTRVPSSTTLLHLAIRCPNQRECPGLCAFQIEWNGCPIKWIMMTRQQQQKCASSTVILYQGHHNARPFGFIPRLSRTVQNSHRLPSVSEERDKKDKLFIRQSEFIRNISIDDMTRQGIYCGGGSMKYARPSCVIRLAGRSLLTSAHPLVFSANDMVY